MFRLYDLNMKDFELPKGVTPLDITISSVQKERITETIENVPGLIDYGSRDSNIDIQIKFFFILDRPDETAALRGEMDRILKDHFYVEENKMPGRVYKVTVPSSYTISRYERNRHAGEMEIPCEISKLPYAESKVPLEVSLTGNAFDIYSDGSVPIEPFHQYLTIELSSIQGSSNYVELVNTSNGSKFRVTEGLNSSARVVVEGVTVLINSGQALRRTTREFLSLDPGVNKLELKGATSANLKMKYKNYYR